MLDEVSVQEFISKGFTILRGAFPKEIANKCREQIIWPTLSVETGIQAGSPESWPSHVGLKRIFWPNDDNGLWDNVLSKKLLTSIDQLVGGKEKWVNENLGLGWWFASFPEQDVSGDWGAHGKWHVDGSHFLHHGNSKEIGLILIFLFSDIEPFAGGTAVSVGSHFEVARILLEHDMAILSDHLKCCRLNEGYHGICGSDLSRLALQVPGILQNIEEINGIAGDVAVLHPFTLHARSRNLGTKGVDSIRIICNPSVQLTEEMDLDCAATDLTPPIVRPILRAKSMILSQRPVLPMAFKSDQSSIIGEKKSKRRNRSRSKATLRTIRRNKNRRLRNKCEEDF